MRVTCLLLALAGLAGCTSGGGGFFRRDLGASSDGLTPADFAGEPVDFASAPIDFANPPATCNDGKQNGGETGVDCGGGCAGCPNGGHCNFNSDCASGNCANGFCAPQANCFDGVRNQGESDVDCGGPCAPCANGRSCNGDGDCQSVNCSSNLCCGGSTGNCDGFAGNGCETSLLADANNCGFCGNVCGFNQTCVNGNCQVMQQVPCSQAALAWCQSKGWSVPVNGQASGGRLYCTTNAVGVNSDCNQCGDYNMIVWSAGAKPAYCQNFNYSTVAGRVYAGHNPCQCGDNLIDCGTWTMGNCIPD